MQCLFILIPYSSILNIPSSLNTLYTSTKPRFLSVITLFWSHWDHARITTTATIDKGNVTNFILLGHLTATSIARMSNLPKEAIFSGWEWLLNKRVSRDVVFPYTWGAISGQNAFQISDDSRQPYLQVSLDFFQVVSDGVQWPLCAQAQLLSSSSSHATLPRLCL